MKNSFLFTKNGRGGALARGFTLVELMITIAIITLLTALIMVDFVQTRGSARDGKRISDLAQIQLTLEQYFDRCGQYPTTIYPSGGNLTTVNNGCPAGVSLASFIAKIPVPPGGGSLTQSLYDYIPVDPNMQSSPPTTANFAPVNYVLHVTLEYPSPTVANGIANSYVSTGGPLGSPYTLYSWNGSSWVTSWTIHTNCYDSASYPTDYCIGPK